MASIIKYAIITIFLLIFITIMAFIDFLVGGMSLITTIVIAFVCYHLFSWAQKSGNSNDTQDEITEITITDIYGNTVDCRQFVDNNTKYIYNDNFFIAIDKKFLYYIEPYYNDYIVIKRKNIKGNIDNTSINTGDIICEGLSALLELENKEIKNQNYKNAIYDFYKNIRNAIINAEIKSY